MAKRPKIKTLLPTALTYLGLAVGLVYTGFPVIAHEVGWAWARSQALGWI